MTLSDFATFSTAISGLAVTASLIYLARQTHQNAKHTRALIQQGRLERISYQQLEMAAPELAKAWLVSNGVVATPEAITERQFTQQCGAVYIGIEDAFTQYADGLISEAQLKRARRRIVSQMKTFPGWRAFVVQRHAVDGTDRFGAFIGELIAQSAVVKPIASLD
jgi:hypothetical protein